MRWIWDADKDSVNRHKHRISFDTAILALNDPLSIVESSARAELRRTIGEYMRDAELTPEQAAEPEILAGMSDADIDTSDIPK